MTPLEMCLPATNRAPRQVRAEVRHWLAARGWPTEDAEDVVLAVCEVVSNSVEHAYHGDLQPEPRVLVRLSESHAPDGHRVETVVDDFGSWRAAAAGSGFRGHGLRVVTALMDTCEVLHRPDGTRVVLVSRPAVAARPGRDVDAPTAPADLPASRGGPDAAGSAGPGNRIAAAEERIRWLEMVTDRGLAHLPVDLLLDELLERVRRLMQVDTAAVLLLDPARQFLVATAAKGIEEEVHQGVRIPLGSGFAGRIAGDRRWVAIEKVDHDNVLNPLLREKGIVSLLGVPLMTGGTVLGVLHVGTLSRRGFGERDAELLRMVADRAALAIQSRMSEAERGAARVMQRHLLPARLPSVPGFEFASRYVAGGEGAVGGDWYDVFTLPSGTLCMVVGDVVGHGLAAAQNMSQLRTALRSNALRADDPSTVLALLDEHVRYFQPGTMATVLCAMLGPRHGMLRISSAGHPPPVLATPDGAAAPVPVTPDPPMGVETGHPRRTVKVGMPDGAVLCLYSDGLVERRRVLIDDNLERLRRSVRAETPEAVCVRVMRDLVGLAVPEDDVALLVARRLRR